MADLTDQQIAILCDVGEYDPLDLHGDKKRDFEWLLAEGYIKPDDDPTNVVRYKLAGKGERVLEARGAGLNES